MRVYAGRFIENDGLISLLNIWWDEYGRASGGSALSQWVVECAAEICA